MMSLDPIVPFCVTVFQAAPCKKNLSAEFDAAADEKQEAAAVRTGEKPLKRIRSKQQPEAAARPRDDGDQNMPSTNEDDDDDENEGDDESEPEDKQKSPSAKSTPSSNPKEHEEEYQWRHWNGDDTRNNSWSYWYTPGTHDDSRVNAWAGYDSWQPRGSWDESWPGWSWDNGASGWWHGRGNDSNAYNGWGGNGWGWNASKQEAGQWQQKQNVWRQTSWYNTLHRATTTDLPSAAATPRTKQVRSPPATKDKELDKREVDILQEHMLEAGNGNEEEEEKEMKVQKKSRARYMRFYRGVSGTHADMLSSSLLLLAVFCSTCPAYLCAASGMNAKTPPEIIQLGKAAKKSSRCLILPHASAVDCCYLG